MTRVKVILVASFILTFAAGWAAGLLVANLPHPRRVPSRIEAELKLNLTDAQRTQMDAIWEQVVGAKMRQWGEQREAMRQERDKAIAALLTADQKQKSETVFAEFAKKDGEQRDALRQERDKAVAALLSDDQRPKYDAILTEFSRKDAEMGDQRKQAFEEAARQTRVILTAEQVVKYDGWIEKQRERGFGPTRGSRRGPQPPPESPPPPRGGE